MTIGTPIVGSDLRLFAKAQSALTTIAADYPSAGDAVQVRVGSFSVTPDASAEALTEEATGITYPVHFSEGAQGGAWGLGPVGAYLSGTSGTAPDFDVLLTSGGWSLDNAGGDSTTMNAAVVHSDNTSIVTVASASGIAAGDGAVLYIGGRAYARIVTNVSGSDVTVAPKLVDRAGNALTPASGDVFETARIYSLKSPMTGADSLTLFGAWTSWQERIVGAYVETSTIDLPAAGVPTIAWQGRYHRRDLLTASTLSAGINDSATSVAVSAPVCDEVLVDDVYLMIGSEIVQVTAVSADGLTLTVTRGVLSSTAVAHNSGDAITPYRPSQTVSVTVPTAAVAGSSMIDTLPGMLLSGSAEVQTGLQSTGQELGDAQMTPAVYQGASTATINGSLTVTEQTAAHLARAAERRERIAVLEQKGNVSGAVLAVWAPKVLLTEPPVASADKLSMDWTGVAMPASASDSALYLIIG